MISAVKKPIEISSIWHSSQDVIDCRITAIRTDEIPNLILSFLLSRCFSNCLFFNGRGRLVRSADKTLMRIRWCPKIRMLSGWPVHFREALVPTESQDVGGHARAIRHPRRLFPTKSKHPRIRTIVRYPVVSLHHQPVQGGPR